MIILRVHLKVTHFNAIPLSIQYSKHPLLDTMRWKLIFNENMLKLEEFLKLITLEVDIIVYYHKDLKAIDRFK
ncbi:hypothetical protein SADUNF_Sadunf16G0201500 [Salix dunnii]|uniref:Uncharacterized protein n=1 Tax=Salix dunnii TaxID=1413687 RepID=A0A835JC73_9ROSI|nr:hypothetical protein SADUNF_Sadunf16G0201500 [Salix dunnii]